MVTSRFQWLQNSKVISLRMSTRTSLTLKMRCLPVRTGYPSKSEKLWSMEKMKTYFCLIRNLQPTLSDVGNQVLLRYYQMQRQSDSRNAARTTIRLLESLIRLAEGLFYSTNNTFFGCPVCVRHGARHHEFRDEQE